jgi:starch synthase
MKILFVSPEVVPFAKTGGLADVAGALPKAIKELGHDIRVILPKFRMVDSEKFGLKTTGITIDVKMGDSSESAEIFEASIPNSDVSVYFVANDKFYDRDELYVVDGKGYEDNAERFILYCRAAYEFLKIKGWQPDVVHGNDWQTAMLNAYIKVLADPFYSKTATVYSIHNMAYQGDFPPEKFDFTDLPRKYFDDGSLRERDKMVLAKGGFSFSDVISSVSETYSREIQTEEMGYGLDKALRARSSDVYGILNGVDYSLWNPSTDPHIAKRYSAGTLSLKVENKIALQKRNGLTVDPKIPMLGIVTRLADQKGVDIFTEAIESILSFGCQIVILGTGDLKYQEMLNAEKKKLPKQIGLNLKFDAELAQLIYAASDMFLMPSKYEPCGLGQLISFKYGVLPIVRKTGGLADTVFDLDPATGEGNGFVFEEYSAAAFVEACRKAIDAYKNNRKLWAAVQKKIMAYDYSWEASAKKYISLYMKALEKVRK